MISMMNQLIEFLVYVESIDDAKGGPFQGYIFYDYENDRTFYISYIVFNPGGKKAFYMRQMEMMLKQ